MTLPQLLSSSLRCPLCSFCCRSGRAHQIIKYRVIQTCVLIPFPSPQDPHPTGHLVFILDPPPVLLPGLFSSVSGCVLHGDRVPSKDCTALSGYCIISSSQPDSRKLFITYVASFSFPHRALPPAWLFSAALLPQLPWPRTSVTCGFHTAKTISQYHCSSDRTSLGGWKFIFKKLSSQLP